MCLGSVGGFGNAEGLGHVNGFGNVSGTELCMDFGKWGLGCLSLTIVLKKKTVNVIHYVHVVLSIFHSLIQGTLCEKS